VTTMTDQPPPIATNRRPAWEIVIEHVERRRGDNAYGKTGVVNRVITDMRDRDLVGRQRYGVALTSGNGRDHLVDAYQELLDYAVYLVAQLDEWGIGPESYVEGLGGATGWRMHCIQQMFRTSVSQLLQLRALIEERAS
jgi:hypothetical protein